MERLMTVTSVAKILRLRTARVKELIRCGSLKASDMGHGARSSLRISETQLRDFLTAREVQPPPPRKSKRSRADPPEKDYFPNL